MKKIKTEELKELQDMLSIENQILAEIGKRYIQVEQMKNGIDELETNLYELLNKKEEWTARISKEYGEGRLDITTGIINDEEDNQ